MAFAALSPRLLESVGSFTEKAWGVAGGSGTTTTVTVTKMKFVDHVMLTGVSTTVAYVSTEPTAANPNVFIVTHGNNELFCWEAIGRGVQF